MCAHASANGAGMPEHVANTAALWACMSARITNCRARRGLGIREEEEESAAIWPAQPTLRTARQTGTFRPTQGGGGGYRRSPKSSATHPRFSFTRGNCRWRWVRVPARVTTFTSWLYLCARAHTTRHTATTSFAGERASGRARVHTHHHDHALPTVPRRVTVTLYVNVAALVAAAHMCMCVSCNLCACVKHWAWEGETEWSSADILAALYYGGCQLNPRIGASANTLIIWEALWYLRHKYSFRTFSITSF